MASRIRQLASETAVYGVSSILGRLINFALVPFYTHVLPVDHYGIVILVYTALVFLQIIFTYGMESAYLRFAAGADGRANVQSTFSSAIWSLTGSSIVLSIILLIFQREAAWVIGIQESWFGLIYFAVAILALDALAVVPMAELRLSSRPWRFASARLLHVAVNVTLNLYLILSLGMGIRAIFIANFAASAAVLLFLTPEFVRYLRPRFDSGLWRNLLRFGLPFVPGGLAYALSERVSLFFLGRMTTDQVLGLYGDQIDVNLISSGSTAAGQAASVYGQYIVSVFGTAYKLAILMMLVSQMFRYAWQPFFLNRANDPDARALFARIFTLFTAGAGFVVLGVSFFAMELVSVPLPGGRHLIPEAYWLGLQIVPLALIGYVFQGWYYNFSVGIYLKKQTRYFIHATIVGGTVSVALTALLVPSLGMMGAAVATTLAFASMAMTLLYFSQKVYSVPYRWGQVGVVCAAAGMCLGLWYFIEALQVWWAEVLIILAYLIVLYSGRIVRFGGPVEPVRDQNTSI